MSQYSHDLRKFADAGLQLRLPVDLVPAMQYSRLTNVLPVIEGELRARDGLTFIADVFKSSYVSALARTDLITNDATIFYNPFGTSPATNAGYVIGQDVLLIIQSNVPPTTFPISQFLVTITGIATPEFSLTGYIFSPPIPGLNWPASDRGPVFAQAIGQGQITTLPNTTITNLFRLNQAAPGFTGDRIAVMAGRIFRAPLPDGNVFIELIQNNGPDTPAAVGNSLSGRPLSIINFRFTDDTASWAIFADQNAMFRYRENPSGNNGGVFFYKLGKPAPQDAASAVDNGSGVLNSTGGTGYDWRYTWHDATVNTEGNPSPITTGPADFQRPHTFTNPDPGVSGASPVSSPGNAIDGSTTSFSTAVGSVTSTVVGPPTGVIVSISTQACLYKGINNPASPPSDDVTLRVVYDATKSGGTGNVQASIFVSQDAGVTYKSIVGQTGTVSQTTATLKLNTGIDYTNIRVRISATATGGGFDSPVFMTLKVYDINVQTSSTSGALVLVNKQAQVTVGSPNVGGPPLINDGRITGIRLYRRGGSLTDAWRLVGTFALTGLAQDVNSNYLLTDNVSDTTLSVQPIMDLDNDEPVTSVNTKNQLLSSIWGPVGLEARVLGCGDPNRPECVYFSKPGNPDAWPPQNFVEVCNPGTPVITGCVFNTRTYAFSREGIYELVEGLGTGTTFAPFKTPSAHGLFAAQAFALGPAIYFVAKDGIYMTTGGQEESLVENDLKPLFPTYDGNGQDVEGYEAVDYDFPDAMRLRYHNDELYFLYIGATTGTRQLLIYDLLKKRWRAAAYTNSISEIYSEPATTSSLLMATTGGAVYQAGGDSDPSELDRLENIVVQSHTTLNTITLPNGFYFVYVSRLTDLGEVAITTEFRSIQVSSNPLHHLEIQVNLPMNIPAGTTGWRVYYGLISGQEDQYRQFPAFTGPNNQVGVGTPGTAGALPVISADDMIHCLLRTGAHDQGAPLNQKQYGNVIFDLDPGGADVNHPITIIPYINGEVASKAAITVTGSGRQQVPLDLSDYFAFNTEYEVSYSRADSNPVLFQYDTLYFLEPVSVRHWQSQPTSFEFPGFVHCRDAYIAIRSTVDVTLTMTFDTGNGEVTQTYTVPSTNGRQQKVYVQFGSNKGLLYRFALDCPAEFRIYEPDLEIRVKPFLGLLGYAVTRPIGGEANA